MSNIPCLPIKMAENDRKPDLRRMERIGFSKPIIENSGDPKLKVWKNIRKREERILIFHEDEDYLVVLADRGNYILLWSAYIVQYANRKRKLLEEYNEYLKTKTAQ